MKLFLSLFFCLIRGDVKDIITTNNSRKNQQILKDFLARRQAEVAKFNKMQIFSLFQLTMFSVRFGGGF
jgi:hypothetical protein